MEVLPSATSLSDSIQGSAPLTKVLPYIVTSLSVLKYITNIIWSTLQWILTALSPLPILLYILSPLIFFLELCAAVFVKSPYRALVYGLEAVQPLYVFCGVACITGGIIGLTGRWVSRVLVRWAEIEIEVEVEGAKKVKTEGYEEEEDLREDEDEEYDEAVERMRQEKERAKERAWIRRRSSSDVKGKGRDRNGEKEGYSVKKEY